MWSAIACAILKDGSHISMVTIAGSQVRISNAQPVEPLMTCASCVSSGDRETAVVCSIVLMVCSFRVKAALNALKNDGRVSAALTAGLAEYALRLPQLVYVSVAYPELLPQL